MANAKINGTGSYTPSNIVKNSDLDELSGKPRGTFEKKTKIHTRYYASDNETVIYMGLEAAKEAIEKSKIKAESLDVIIFANSVPFQPIPCSAAFLQRELGLEESGIPCFDINATCLSHLVAMEQLAPQIQYGKYSNALVVSSEVASKGLNYDQVESSGLIGDGAAATILSKTEEDESSKLISSLFRTYSSGIESAQIKGGGSRIHPKETSGGDKVFTFDMDGREIYKLANQKIPPFLNELFEGTGYTLDDIDIVIPHQASFQSLQLMTRKLNLERRVVNIVQDVGNQVSASIPYTLNYAIEEEVVKRGDKVLMLGTGAGLSIGGLFLEY